MLAICYFTLLGWAISVAIVIFTDHSDHPKSLHGRW
jgi:hypothetical protein